MSEMISAVEGKQKQPPQQQHSHQQQNFGINVAEESLQCRDCNIHFDSISSLDVHLRYHHPRSINDWMTRSRENNNNSNSNNNNKSNNNNNDNNDNTNAKNNYSIDTSNCGSKKFDSRQQERGVIGSINEHVHTGGPLEQNSQTLPLDPNESGSHSGSTPIMTQQPQLQPQGYDQNFSLNTFGDAQYFMNNEYGLSSPSFVSEEQQHEGRQSPQDAKQRFCPYKIPEHNRTSSIKEVSPPDRFHCDKCNSIHEDAAQLADHLRLCHALSPSVHYLQRSPTTDSIQQPQAHYQQLAADNQQQQLHQAQAQQSMHAPATQSQFNHHSQHVTQQPYDFGIGIMCKSEKEPEEHAEILDLDSHKVQTHRYEDQYFSISQQQPHQSDIHVRSQQHSIHQQQQDSHRQHPHHHYHQEHITHSEQPVSWSIAQPQDYRGQMVIDSVSPLQEQQSHFMRGHPSILPIESRSHATSPLIASSQQILTHSVPSHIITQNSKSPLSGNQSWKSNEARRPKTYNCTACNKWFTSSGHLKRHYNTTLHKNAVKQSNLPDPATLPISAHHHPNRGDSASSRRTNGNRVSPDQSSSSSPPNLMAGPSGKALRGLPHTPITSMNMLISRNSFSNGSDTAMVQTISSQNTVSPLHQQQQHMRQKIQSEQQPHSQTMLAPPLLLNHSPLVSPTEQMQQRLQLHQQHPHFNCHQQTGSLSLPSPHQFHQSSMGSNLQVEDTVRQPMNTPMSPIQRIHMNSPMPTALSHHQHQQLPDHLDQNLHQHLQQTIGSTPPTVVGVIPATMTSSPPQVMMEDTVIPQQIYPNELSPHVTTTIKTPEQPVCTISPQTTTGNLDQEYTSDMNQKNQLRMLPGFCTINQQSSVMRTYDASNAISNDFALCENFVQAVNVGGSCPKESASVMGKSTDPPTLNSDDIYQNSISSYEQKCKSSGQLQSKVNNEQIQEDAKIDSNPIHKKESDLKNKKNIIKNKIDKTSSSTAAKNHKFDNGKVQCTLCEKSFYKLCYLTQHNRSFHEGVRPYKCEKCGKRFFSEEKYEKHELTHLGDKPHKCEVCPKGFSHKTDLRRHMCIHTGVTPFNCSLCAKKFTRKDHMEKHFAGHSKKTNHKNNINRSNKIKNSRKCQKNENNNNSLESDDLNKNGTNNQDFNSCDGNENTVNNDKNHVIQPRA